MPPFAADDYLCSGRAPLMFLSAGPFRFCVQFIIAQACGLQKQAARTFLIKY